MSLTDREYNKTRDELRERERLLDKRQEAAEQIRELCAIGDVTDVELHSILSG